MSIIVGIDIGGSTTKIVGLKNSRPFGHMTVQAGDPVTSAYGAFGKFLSENCLQLSDISKVVCTGVGATFLQSDIYGIKAQKVDEFLAIGLGGKYSSGFDNAVVVSMGTGTAIISVNGDEIKHVCGTGVGGGTVLGLSGKLIGSRNFNHIIDLSAQGDLTKIDLTIGDISKNEIQGMSDKTTASNFGKISDDASNADLAAGVVNLVFQTVGIFAMMAARAQNTTKIVLTGNLSQAHSAGDIIRHLEELYGMEYVIPENSDYATAIGAALCGTRMA